MATGTIAFSIKSKLIMLFVNRPLARGTKFGRHRQEPLWCWLGAVLGVLVTLTSIGAGAFGVVALLVLKPHMPLQRIVGTDIAHAIPLTLVGGIGFAMLGQVDWGLLFNLGPVHK